MSPRIKQAMSVRLLYSMKNDKPETKAKKSPIHLIHTRVRIH